ncbi:MAG TPA: LysM peptidoglycan-binding domain-containing protein [Myxococcaceae bacterium]|nr:LysM peptidoglycan-binding domain-containing protein [Myxococcaceae bacterium]
MRNTLIAPLVASLALASPSFAAARAKTPQKAPAKAPAQTDAEEGEEGSEEEGAETEGAEVADQPIRMGPTGNVPQGGRTSAPGEVHTVVRGDTLWDLSRTYLGNPWYWPKVWSYNPEIANPHWIYPGNQVRFFGAGEDVPARVEAGPAGQIVGEDVTGSEMIAGEDASEVEVVGKIGYQPKATRVIHDGFATPKELEESGTITGSFSGSLLYSFPETIYIDFKKRGEVRVGDKFVIFHTDAEIMHPRTGKLYGYLTRLLGSARVTSVGKEVVSAQILETWEPITRGDMVGPYGERMGELLQARPNTKEARGYIVGALVSQLNMVGEFYTAIIDKGSADGVQPGNTFVIQGRAGHSPDLGKLRVDVKQPRDLPWEDLGTCIAVDVKENASTCYVTRSLRELHVGDPVEMRVDKAAEPVSQR